MQDRHQFRALWHDYNSGVFFITICTHEKHHILGEIVGTRFIASAIGMIVEEHINMIPTFHSDVEVWNYVVMPNHIHLVLYVGTRVIASTSADSNVGCLKPPRHGLQLKDLHHNSRLATIIGSFKAGITRTVRTRLIASLPDNPIWQSRFHEHIIRNQRSYENIMHYIDTNVENWSQDCFAK